MGEIATRVEAGGVQEWPAELLAEWDTLVASHGCGFQASAVLRTIESCWEGQQHPMHITAKDGDDRLIGLVPAYLVESCPRLDYYRWALPECELTDPVLLSHSLLGWYGFPVGCVQDGIRCAVGEFLSIARERGAVAMFAGIDARDHRTIAELKAAGFVVARYQTIVVRSLLGIIGSDPTTSLDHKRRGSVRARLSRARQNGVRVRLATERDHDQIVALIRRVIEIDTSLTDNPGYLPAGLIRHMLADGPPSLDAVLAVDERDRPVGVHVNIVSGSRYFIWLVGHDHSSWDRYKQSHLLFEASAARALELGCAEVQGGRSPYRVKLDHGFVPVPWLAAVRGSNPSQHQAAVAWLEGLEDRHHATYDSEFHGKLARYESNYSVPEGVGDG